MVKVPHPVVKWEEKVFSESNKFMVTLYRPFGQSKKEEFRDYPSAYKKAEELTDSHGRGPLIYAINAAGRQVAIGATEREKYLALWNRTRS